MDSHISALVPSACDKRNAISALTPARPLRSAENACRVTPKRRAASVTVMPSGKYSRITSPGCAGLCILRISLVLYFSVIIQIIHFHRALIFKSKDKAPHYSPILNRTRSSHHLACEDAIRGHSYLLGVVACSRSVSWIRSLTACWA